MTSPQRTFLFLQGLASPFFAKLGRELLARGHRVRKVNLSLGDQLFWPFKATSYRGSAEEWRAFLSRHCREHGVTDVILFGDCRPYHRVAIALAEHRGFAVHVFEEGYLRPNWITAERGGVNGFSLLPRDPEVVRALGGAIEPPPEAHFASSFVRRASWDVIYSIASAIGRPIFPAYSHHRPNHVFAEYAAWLRRIGRRRRARRHADAEVERAVARQGGYYLVPMQLDTDYQIRVHSRYGDLGEFLDEVFASFAAHAPAEAELVVKVHPLDSGLIDRERQVAGLVARHGLGTRVRLIDGGYLPTLLVEARGVVVVNSTVGTGALQAGRPTIALGPAIYDVAGLTYQGGLDGFWTEAPPPDPELFECFRKLIIQQTQVNGGYFSKTAIRMAVPGAADRVSSLEPLPRLRPAGFREPEAEQAYGQTQPAE